jgi:hypothetical protein
MVRVLFHSFTEFMEELCKDKLAVRDGEGLDRNIVRVTTRRKTDTSLPIARLTVLIGAIVGGRLFTCELQMGSAMSMLPEWEALAVKTNKRSEEVSNELRDQGFSVRHGAYTEG